LHHTLRRRRILATGQEDSFRPGELDLTIFWKRYEEGTEKECTTRSDTKRYNASSETKEENTFDKKG
jgi:hypothetical protein